MKYADRMFEVDIGTRWYRLVRSLSQNNLAETIGMVLNQSKRHISALGKLSEREQAKPYSDEIVEFQNKLNLYWTMGSEENYIVLQFPK